MDTKSKNASDQVGQSVGQAGKERGLNRWWVRQLMAFGLFVVAGVVLIATIGFVQRSGWFESNGTNLGVLMGPSSKTESDAIHTCPMHPQIRQPGPGNCPICGMALVPATVGSDANVDELAVNIEPTARRLANIHTAEVKRETVVTTIETIGEIAIDESRMSTIPSYIDGRIEELFADYTGVKVAKGDHLAVVYSPELYSAQVEYLESRKALANSTSTSLQAVRQAQEKLVSNSRQRLVELGLNEEQLQTLEETGEAKSRLTIYTTVGGTVIEKMAMEGKYVKAGEPIYRIADLSTVWLMLELYPEDASRIRFGQRVDAVLPSLPGEVFEGRVAFIDPLVNEKQRTVGVRVEFMNEDGRLRPGDYANAKIYLPIGQRGEVYDSELANKFISPMHPQIISDKPGECPICGMDLVPTRQYGYSDQPVEQPESLYVPRSAVLMAGTNSVVYIETDPGRFEIRAVTLGPLLKDRVVILSGLKVGEKVAMAGNFLIDSQMQLAGKPSLIDPTKAIIAQRERKTPLEFESIEIQSIPGENGEKLSELYEAYFAIQQSLANDQKPSEANAQMLHQRASELATVTTLSEKAREQLDSIAKYSEHLHHLEIDNARLQAFRPISHAIVTLATKIRSSETDQPYSHMFCPMVKGGAGDWLQSNDELRNPYWGSQMLTCGDVVRQLPSEGAIADDASGTAIKEEAK